MAQALETIEFAFDVEQFRAFIHNHPTSERLRWWKAKADPTFSRAKGTTSPGGQKYLRVEQNAAQPYMALIQGERALRRYLPQGAIETGDLAVTTMSDELQLTEHDWLVPVGRKITLTETIPEARTFAYKETLQRGANEVAGFGTLASVGNNVTGTGTQFLATFVGGDILRVNGKSYPVVSVTDDQHLLLSNGPTLPWAGNSYTKAMDRLTFPIGAYIESVESVTDPAFWVPGFEGDVTVYEPQRDCRISDDGESVQWLSTTNAPAPGVLYGITYWYYPRYVVMGDLGLRRHVVDGKSLPQCVHARLWKPESLRE